MSGRFRNWCLAAAALSVLPGVALAQAQAQGQGRTEKKFEAWTVSCQEASGKKNCALSQALTDSKNKKLSFAWIITKGDDGSEKAVLRTPVGVLLPAGVKVAIGSAKPVTAPFRFCGPRACTAELPFGSDLLKAFAGTEEITAAFSSAAGQPATVKINLTGFAPAHDFFVSQ